MISTLHAADTLWTDRRRCRIPNRPPFDGDAGASLNRAVHSANDDVPGVRSSVRSFHGPFFFYFPLSMKREM